MCRNLSAMTKNAFCLAAGKVSGRKESNAQEQRETLRPSCLEDRFFEEGKGLHFLLSIEIGQTMPG